MSTSHSESGNGSGNQARRGGENSTQLVPRRPGPTPRRPLKSLYKRIDRLWAHIIFLWCIDTYTDGLFPPVPSYDADYAEWRVVSTPTEIVHSQDEYSDFAFLVRRNLDQEKQYQDTILIIKSSDLGQIINAVVHNVEGLSVIGNSSEV
jgi:hypothetical protein